MHVKTILVPVDLGPLSDAALERAVAIARPFGSAIVLLHVVQTSGRPVIIPPGTAGVPVTAAPRTVSVDEQRSRLRTLAGRFLTPGVSMRQQVEVTSGAIARCILRAARQEQSDLIVMSTHGRHGLKRFVLGSIAEEVVRDASQPVLLVPTAATTKRRRDRDTEQPGTFGSAT